MPQVAALGFKKASPIDAIIVPEVACRGVPKLALETRVPSDRRVGAADRGQGMVTGGLHRAEPRRCAIRGVEAFVLLSDRSFPRHAHDQFGIGVLHSGAHRS